MKHPTMSPKLTTLLVMAAVSAAAFPAHSTEDAPVDPIDPVDRHKFGVQLGGGYGRITTDGGSGVFGETSSTPDEFTVGLEFAFDYSYRKDEKVSVDGFINFWSGTLSGDLGNESWSFGIMGGGFRWHPMGGDFFLRAGFGGGGVAATLEDPTSDEGKGDFSDYGLGALVTVGYDMSVAADFTAGPRAEAVALDVGDGVTAVAMNALFAFAW